MDHETAAVPEEFANWRVRSFVRRQGRISSGQERSYETLFHRYGITGNEDGFLECNKIFGNNCPLVIEIGFGMGRATAAIAHDNREINYLGIEVHKPGIGRLLGEIERLELKNMRIVEGDAAEIVKNRIKDNSVSAFHIFFPDPWPKKRHHKRRLITRPFTDLLAAKLSNGAYVYMVSDWADYADWALRELSSTPGLVNRYNAYAVPQAWRPETEFERKGIDKNHEIRELYFEKRKN